MTAMGYRYGFKAETERLATSTRRELGLGNYHRLDPLALAQHLAIQVLSFDDLSRQPGLPNDVQAALELLRGTEASAVSAITVSD